MSPQALVQLGLAGLMTHKLRSLLSLLGVLFGVAAVVAMSSVGEGARREVLAQIGALGIDSISVRARADPGPAPLHLAEATALTDVVPGLLAVAAVREASAPALALGRQAAATVVGTTPSYGVASRLRVSNGRFLSDLDVRESKRVAVLGASLARQLAPLEPIRGESVRLGGEYFTVVGVLEDRAAPAARGNPIRTLDINRSVFIPIGALDFGSRADREAIDGLVLRVADGRRVDEAAEVVRAVLRRRSAGAVDVVVPREILRQRQRTQRVFNVVTGAVAAIGLLVGGIGIMNIMLASVAERTHEIGVRRACGATRGDIARQFLSESLLLTGGGGLLGALLGIAGSVAIQRWADWPTALSAPMLAAAWMTAFGVGIGFGSYPALLAARLEPAEALRRE